jgi:hypothetical protein
MRVLSLTGPAAPVGDKNVEELHGGDVGPSAIVPRWPLVRPISVEFLIRYFQKYG